MTPEEREELEQLRAENEKLRETLAETNERNSGLHAVNRALLERRDSLSCSCEALNDEVGRLRQLIEERGGQAAQIIELSRTLGILKGDEECAEARAAAYESALKTIDRECRKLAQPWEVSGLVLTVLADPIAWAAKLKEELSLKELRKEMTTEEHKHYDPEHLPCQKCAAYEKAIKLARTRAMQGCETAKHFLGAVLDNPIGWEKMTQDTEREPPPEYYQQQPAAPGEPPTPVVEKPKERECQKCKEYEAELKEIRPLIADAGYVAAVHITGPLCDKKHQPPAAPGKRPVEQECSPDREPPSPVVEPHPEVAATFCAHESRLNDLKDRIAKIEHRLRDGTNWEILEARLQAVEAMTVRIDAIVPVKQPAWYEELIDRLAKLEVLVAKDWDEIQELKAMLVPEERKEDA